MVDPSLIGGLIGGLLIGLAAVLLLAVNGRIAGISGILGGLFIPTSENDRAWRAAFIAGLICGAGFYRALGNELPIELQLNAAGLAGAGLLVGIGTRLGSGCTSGHGVCGLARRSKRSLLATLIFMALAILTVFVTRHVIP